MSKGEHMIGRMVGPYRVEQELGRGGMGTVYLARGPEGDRVALKVLHRHLGAERLHVERFRREAEAGARLQHPGILQTLDAGQMADGHHYFAMEYFQGRTVEDLIRSLGPFAELQGLVVGYRVARALEYAHGKRILHRDIKPANVMLNRAGDVRIADFGLAQVWRDQKLTADGSFLGTPAYCPPEQLRGEPLDARADVYALGASMYEMLTGKPPYEGRTPFEVMEAVIAGAPTPMRELRGDIDERTVDVVMSMMRGDRDKRMPTATNAVVAIEDRIRQVMLAERMSSGFEEQLTLTAEHLFVGGVAAEPTHRSQGSGRAAGAEERAQLDTLPGGRPATPAGRKKDPGQVRVLARMTPQESAAPARRRVVVPTQPLVTARHVGVAAVLLVGLAVLALLTNVEVAVGAPLLLQAAKLNAAAPRRLAVAGFTLLGPEVAPRLIEALPDAPAPQRQAIYAALRRLRTPESTQALLAGITDEDPIVRQHALYGLVALDVPQARAWCVELLDDPDPRVRLAAVSGLQSESDPVVLPKLVAAYVGADQRLAQEITRAVVPYGQVALPYIGRVWDELDNHGKREAITAVHRIGGTPAIRLLLSKLDEPKFAVRFFIVDALQRMTAQDIGDDPKAWRRWAKEHLPEA